MLDFKKILMTCSIATLLVAGSNFAHAGDECSTDFRDTMREYAQAQRVQDYAIAVGVLKQSESTMALTCFDDLVARTSRAGEIFSDEPPSAAMATWGATAYDIAGITNGIGLYHSTIGLTNLLGFDLSYVVSSQLMPFLNSNFDGHRLPAASYGSDWYTDVNGAVGGLGLGSYVTIISSVQGLVSGSSYNCDNMQTFWDDYATRQGIEDEIPFMSYDELVSVTYPGSGPLPHPHPTSRDSDYEAVFTANSGILSAADTRYTNMTNAADQVDYDFEREMPTAASSTPLSATSTITDIVNAM